MNVKNMERTYEQVMDMKRFSYVGPKKPNILFRTLLKIVSMPDLIATGFKCERRGMEKLGKNEPCLILMNHSSFIDLKIASSVLYPRKFNIVSTLDAFIGKKWLMRQLGCIPTRKFVFDLGLVKDMRHCVSKLGTSVLMYPEAGYTFDGRSTVLPDSLGGLVKLLGVPLVMLKTYGAFQRDPLYNELQTRKVRVSATLEYLLSGEQIKDMSADEIGALISEQFSFDSFRWQKENGISVKEPFRADGLHRLLYKCPACKSEGHMKGSGTTLECRACSKKWTMREYGFSEDVDVYMVVNADGVFKVGDGKLTHTVEGFRLVGCDGKIDYFQKSMSLYTLNSDFYWYKLGDVIGIGNHDALYYCIPKTRPHLVCKARLATEEIYRRIDKRGKK